MTLFYAGERLSAAKLNSLLPGQQSWTPTIGQGGATPDIAKTVNEGAYVIAQGWLTGAMFCTIGGTGTVSQPVTVSLPVAPAAAFSVAIGFGFLVDATTGNHFPLIAYRSALTTATFIRTNDESNNPFVGLSGFTAALDAGDLLTLNVSYRVAA